jgi:transposase
LYACRKRCSICPSSHNCVRCSSCVGQKKHVSPPPNTSSCQQIATQPLIKSSNTVQQHRRRSELDRWRIIVYYGDGLSIGEISLRLHCDRRTVYRWVWSYYRNDVNEKIGSRGRKRKIDDDMACQIVEHVKRVKFVTPRDVKYYFDLNVCNRTVDRLLIEHGLFGRVARKRHPKMNSKKRLSFAEGKKWQEMSRNVKKYVKEFLEISHMFMYRVLEVRLEQGDLL